MSPIKLIDFNEDNKLYLLKWAFKVLDRSSNPEDWKDDELRSMREPYRSALHSFLVDLCFYHKGLNGKFTPFRPERLLIRSLYEGPSFAKFMDGFKNYVLVRKTKRHLLKLPEDFDSFTTYHLVVDDMKDFRISDIYRSNKLFNWTPPILNVKEVVTQKPEINYDYLQEFRCAVRDYLTPFTKIPLQATDLLEIVSDSSTSTAEGKNWQQKFEYPASKRGISKMVNIPRELKEQRSACMEEISSLLRIKWINTTLMKILRLEPKCAANYEAEQLEKDMLFDLKGNRVAYCRDFKKEGLTKPHIIATVMMEELKKAFPNERAFEADQFFSSWKIDLNGEIIETSRGHGLGMANELTTLMQLAIERMVRRRVDQKTIGISRYLNDDAIVILKDWSSAKSYRLHDRTVCTNLGLDFKDKASFLCIGSGVICEVYASTTYEDIQNKELFEWQSFGNLYKSINSSHLRSIFNVPDIIPDSDIKELLNRYGPVLERNEFKKPRSLGGWNPFKDLKVDLSYLNKIGDMPLDNTELSAYYAYKKTKLFYCKKGKKYTPKIYSLLPKEFLKLKNVPEFLNNEIMFRPSMEPERNTKSWINYQRILRKNFVFYLNQKKKYKKWSKLYFEDLDRYPKEDFIPPIGFREPLFVEEKRTYKTKQYNFPYSTASIKHEYNLYVAYGNKVFYPIEMGRGWIEGTILVDSVVKEMRRKSQIGDSRNYSMISLPNDRSIEFYHDPIAVQQACEKYGVNWGMFIPNHPIDEKRRSLFKSRELYYGPITIAEWYLISLVKPTDQWIIAATRNYWEMQLKDLADFIRLLKNIEGIGAFVAPYTGNFTKMFNEFKSILLKRKKWKHFEIPILDDWVVPQTIDEEAPNYVDPQLIAEDEDIDYNEDVVTDNYDFEEYFETDYNGNPDEEHWDSY